MANFLIFLIVIASLPFSKDLWGQDTDSTVRSVQVTTQRGNTLKVSAISLEYAQELFDYVHSQKEIPFRFPDDGCYARAHAMAILLEREGIISLKAFIEGDLLVETYNHPLGYVRWWFHTAPVVLVEDGGRFIEMVLDPSIFDKPVPVEEWFFIQTKHSEGWMEDNYRTNRFGFMPYDRHLNLTGYRRRDVSTTINTLKRYKAYEDYRIKRRIIPPALPKEIFSDTVVHIELRTGEYWVRFASRAAVYKVNLNWPGQEDILDKLETSWKNKTPVEVVFNFDTFTIIQ